MTDQLEHNPGDHEDPLAGPTWLIMIGGAVVFVVVLLVVAAVAYRVMTGRQDAAALAQAPRDLAALKEQQRRRLTDPPRFEKRIDSPEDGNSLVIPIEQAMELMVQEAQR